MRLHPQSPAKFLPATLRSFPIDRGDMERFKSAFASFLEKIEHAGKETEEHLKNLAADFLKDAFYKDNYYLNTKGRSDLVIHTDKTAKAPVGVLLEVKRPGNQSEMVQPDKPNTKALHELLLYFLRERQDGDNKQIKHLVVTNVQDWYIFDAADFERQVYNNKTLLKNYADWREGRMGAGSTDWFYKEIAAPFFEKNIAELSCCHFSTEHYKKALLKDDEKGLTALYKILSPELLLKKAFANDSNALNKPFYDELLYILGLEEDKDPKTKKRIIKRADNNRHDGSLLENTLNILRTHGRWNELPDLHLYGDTPDEQQFSIALELCITWLNRILFLKLLEGQLKQWNPDPASRFLTVERIADFDELNELFFEVLAVPEAERTQSVTQKFGNIPYLNSSLFEQTELERRLIRINSLKDRLDMPIWSKTVLRNTNNKRQTGSRRTMHYLFDFLEAYDFSSTGTELVRDDKRDLISASVLGLIFEKINGYRDGSYFTPGFVTMYMVQQSLHRAVLDRFNTTYNWQAAGIEDLHNQLDYARTAEYNQLINSLRICDPAVGSGHFLVSALNELIALKSALGILCDREGRRLRDIRAEVGNDELVITHTDSDKPFEYMPGVRESQRIQEALFVEKQTLIENCLFGVDINPKSVMICRLRLWIELLKHAYFVPLEGVTGGGSLHALETLPNIDINIKTGNSLVNRFPLSGRMRNAKQQRAFKKMTDTYRIDVWAYKQCKSRSEKDELRRRLAMYKQEFDKFYDVNDPDYQELRKHDDLLLLKTSEIPFAEDRASWNEQVRLLTEKTQSLRKAWEQKNRSLYRDAFEWRFEFPEVLDEEGQFAGFDCIVGNPPYIRQEELGEWKPYFAQAYRDTYAGTADLYVYFVERGMQLLRPGGQFSYIIPNKWMRAGYGERLRRFVLKQRVLGISDFGDLPVFEEATTYPCILEMQASAPAAEFPAAHISTLELDEGLHAYLRDHRFAVAAARLQASGWTLSDPAVQALMDKLRRAGTPLGEYVEGKIYYGIKTGLNEAFVIDAATRERLITEDPRSAEVIKPFLAGRDIKRYQTPVSDKYLLFIPWHFPLHNDPTVKGASVEAEESFQKEYPAVFNHLLKYKPKLENRNKAETGIRYEWYALQRWAAGYYTAFEEVKIIVPAIIKSPQLTIDSDCIYSNDKTTIISTDELSMLGVLNSSVVDFFMQRISSTKQGGFFEYKPVYISQIPIPKLPEQQKSQLTDLVTSILSARREDSTADTIALEVEVDRLVYGLYGLSEEEVGLVEGKM